MMQMMIIYVELGIKIEHTKQDTKKLRDYVYYFRAFKKKD